MSIKAMKQALEALEEYQEKGAPFMSCDSAVNVLRQAIEAAEKQEPVAWRTFDGEGGYDYRTYDGNESYADDWNKRNPNHKNWVEPLYAHPPMLLTPN